MCEAVERSHFDRSERLGFVRVAGLTDVHIFLFIALCKDHHTITQSHSHTLTPLQTHVWPQLGEVPAGEETALASDAAERCHAMEVTLEYLVLIELLCRDVESLLGMVEPATIQPLGGGGGGGEGVRG